MKPHKYIAISLKITLVVAMLAGISSGCGGGGPKVNVKRVGPRSIKQTVVVAGNLQAANPTQVIPQVYGTVQQVYVEDGQEVGAGEALVQLDTSNLEQALLSAKAGLESTQSMASMFNSLSASASSVSSGLYSSTNSLLSSMDAIVAGLYELEKILISTLPESQRMSALQAIESSYQQYLTTREANAPSMPSVSTGGVSTGAQQASANKAIENARKDLEEATITAPVAGTLVGVTTGGMSIESMMGALMSSFSGMMPSGLDISALTGISSSFGAMGMPTPGALAPGSYVMPGSPIYTIVNLRDMTMTAKVDETDVVKIQPEQTATVTLEAYPGQKFQGKVVKVADTATVNEAGATAFDVTVQLDPVEVNMKIGMTGTADVVVASKEDALVVPIEAIVEKKNKKYVFKVFEGKAHLTEVKLGITTESEAEIIKGVKTGDHVVIKGAEKLKDGQGVKT